MAFALDRHGVMVPGARVAALARGDARCFRNIRPIVVRTCVPRPQRALISAVQPPLGRAQKRTFAQLADEGPLMGGSGRPYPSTSSGPSNWG